MSPVVFLGGAPENLKKVVKEKVGFSESFHGCIRLLHINGHILFDVSKHINKAKEVSNVGKHLISGDKA